MHYLSPRGITYTNFISLSIKASEEIEKLRDGLKRGQY